ncbi:hypothetical protein KRR26_15085 [Corallococcus sp. M34]|uniref:hypothetical protein n=1 Tax=Citreicoccus inhibens TaxID=2849499 RepID=UPI001C23D1BD|nr:hypothetical protein [Citreicoccus inhibens]MBU8896942.1 hypothetical protein [Citreicoccus inhibens]
MTRLAWVLGGVLLLGGCASPQPVARPAPPETSAVTLAPLQTASVVKEVPPQCPEDIVNEPGLELDLSPEMQARAWVASLAPVDLGFNPDGHVERLFQRSLPLAVGPVEVVGLGEPARRQGWSRLLIARPHAQGYCMVNGWTTVLPGATTLSLAGTWISPDSRVALLLLKVLLVGENQRPEVRWVTLGTDGHRAWIALGTPPEHQLLVPSVTFSPNGKDLYLDIHQRYVTRLRLGSDGRFIVPPPVK